MIVALLLAAGHSRRMRRQKLLLPIAGKTLLQHSLDRLLASAVDRVLVIVPPGGFQELETRSEPRAATVVNARAEEGMSSSIRAGLDALPRGTRAVLIALADQPLVRPQTINAVLEAFARTRAPIVFPTHEGRRGHPVLIARSLFGEARRLRGDVGAKGLVERHAAGCVAVPVDDAGILQDVDSPEDYAAILRVLGPSSPRPAR